MKTKILSLLYFTISLMFIVLEGHSSFTFELVLKGLIIPVLIVIFTVNMRPYLSRIQILFLAALFFSWAGDVILELTQMNGNMFIFGLVSFLLAHIMYLLVFLLTPGKNVILNKRVSLLIPVLVYGAGLLYYLYDDLNEMRIPVIIYTCVILTMLSAALNRIDKVNRSSYWFTLSGAVLFVISDSAIAINKFSHTFNHSSAVIMTTYIIAQFLIVTGYIRQYRKTFS
jgi:uncharacterized membrane protein YhhN